VLLAIPVAAVMIPPLVASAEPKAASPGAPRGQLIGLVADYSSGRKLGGFVIATMTTRGKNFQLVAPEKGGPLLGDFVFTWSPNGRFVAYPCSSGINDQRYGVCAANIITRVNVRITRSPSIKIEPYAWGPANEIASSCNDRDLCFVNARTGRVTLITRVGPSARDAYVFGDDLVWSPNGQTLAFTCRRNDQQDRRFCFVGPDGKLRMQATSWNAVRVEGWTPDSKKIVWWGRFSGSEPLAYHEQNADGTGLEPLPKNAIVVGPKYSADGRRRLTTPGKDAGIGVQPVSGGPARPILGTRSGVFAWDYAYQP